MNQRGKLLSISLAFVVIAGLVLAITLGNKLDSGGQITAEQAKEVNSLFAGIPQNGRTLGNPKAKETLVEFVDLQCPACAAFSKDALPELINGPVRKGEIKLELRLLTFLGLDSSKAALAAEAAAGQDKAWQFVELFYLNQGIKESGYVTDSFIEDIYRAIDIDVQKANKAIDTPMTSARVAADAALAERVGISSTPTLVLLQPAERPRVLNLQGLDYNSVQAALTEARR